MSCCRGAFNACPTPAVLRPILCDRNRRQESRFCCLPRARRDPARAHNSRTPPLLLDAVGFCQAGGRMKKGASPSWIRLAPPYKRRLTYRLRNGSNSARSSDRRAPQGPPAARSATSLLSNLLPTLPGGRTVCSARRPTAWLAVDRRFGRARGAHLARPLAMPEVPLRLYRLPRLSYCPTSVSPRPACWKELEAISNAIGRPIGKRAGPAACPSGMNDPTVRPMAHVARCTWRRSGNFWRGSVLRPPPCKRDCRCSASTIRRTTCTAFRAPSPRTNTAAPNVAISSPQRAECCT